jgi:RND family efflux transporter MFP subunit
MDTNNTDLSSLKIDRSVHKRDDNPRKKQLYKFGYISVILLLILFAAMKAWDRYMDKSIEVKTTEAVIQLPSSEGSSLTASGYIVAQRKAAVASKGTGRLVYLGVVEGDAVKKEQIIARLDDSDIKAQLAQAEANLKLSMADFKDAERGLNRQRALLKSGSTTEEAVDAAEAKYQRVLANIEISKASIQSAKVSLENMLVRAPFNGTVLTKDADVGEVVSPLSGSATSRAAVVTMADMSSLQAEVDVSESNIQRISPNQECKIILDAYPSVEYEGYVTKIVPTADRSKATVLVKVAFKNYDRHVLPEMSAKVSFYTKESNESRKNEKPVLLVPSSAVRVNGEKKTVFIIKNNVAEESVISTGRQFGSNYEVLSGLSGGEKIVDSPSDNIKDGTKIKIK